MIRVGLSFRNRGFEMFVRFIFFNLQTKILSLADNQNCTQQFLGCGSMSDCRTPSSQCSASDSLSIKLKPLYSPKKTHKIYQNLTLNPAQATKHKKLTLKSLAQKTSNFCFKIYHR